MLMKRLICFVIVLTLFASMSVFALEPDHTMLYHFLRLDATKEITSIVIQKANPDSAYDIKQTINKEQIAEFIELAQSTMLKPINTGTIDFKGGIYLQIAYTDKTTYTDNISYAFIGADGGVDEYSIFMSRLPFRQYQIDSESSLAQLGEFCDSLSDDIADDWAIVDIKRAMELEMLPEHLQNGYRENTTRERFCEVINDMIQMDGLAISVKPSEPGQYDFDDCKNPAVVYLHNLGIVFGKGNGIFDPDGLLTRQEAATIICRLMKEFDLGYEIINNRDAYGDSDQIADWALEGVNTVSDWGIMKGDGTNFMPKGKYTHQQAIVTVMRVYNEIVLSRQPIEALEIPKEVQTVVENYMNAYKIGTDKSVEYAHFEEDFIREAYIAANDKLIDYIVESADKINDKLYQFTILIESTQTHYLSDGYLRVYNFVGLVNDKWYFINGVSNIPKTIKDNLDESKYKYEGDDIVSPDDIIGRIDIFSTKASGNPLPIDFSTQIVRTDGYNEDISYPVITTVSSVKELNSYYEKYKNNYNLKSRKPYTTGFADAIEKYNDDYFKNSSLVIVILEEGSGSIRHSVSEVMNDGKIVIKRNPSDGGGTDDMAQWHVIIEIPKEYSNLTYTLV